MQKYAIEKSAMTLDIHPPSSSKFQVLKLSKKERNTLKFFRKIV